MSNLVCTLEEQANLAEEIELTDAQLAAVFGAHDHCCHKSDNRDDSDNCNKKKSCSGKHVKISKTFHEHFEFSFDLLIKEDEDEDDVSWDDSDW